MDKLTSIRVFCEVARLGRFSAAARELELSTAMVSKHVKRLEDELGVRLLNRSTRQCSLTEAGAAYYGRCTRILGELDETEFDVRDLSGEVRGTLKVSAPATFGTLYLVPALVDYKQRYPGIEVNLRLGGQVPDLFEAGYDLAIHAGGTQLDSTSVVARKLGSFGMEICAAAAYLQRRGRPTHPRQLAEHNCLVFHTEIAHDEWVFQGPEGEISVQVRGDLHCNQGNALRMAARGGLGIVRLPNYLVQEDLREGALQAILTEYQSAPRAVYALFPHRRHMPAKVRSFVDFLTERFRAETRFGTGAAAPAAVPVSGADRDVDGRMNPAPQGRSR